LKDNSLSQAAWGNLSQQEQAQNTKIVRGNFVNIERPQYTEAYSNLITHVQGGEK
jgi:hypothetical protein